MIVIIYINICIQCGRRGSGIWVRRVGRFACGKGQPPPGGGTYEPNASCKCSSLLPPSSFSYRNQDTSSSLIPGIVYDFLSVIEVSDVLNA